MGFILFCSLLILIRPKPWILYSQWKSRIVWLISILGTVSLQCIWSTKSRLHFKSTHPKKGRRRRRRRSAPKSVFFFVSSICHFLTTRDVRAFFLSSYPQKDNNNTANAAVFSLLMSAIQRWHLPTIAFPSIRARTCAKPVLHDVCCDVSAKLL